STQEIHTPEIPMPELKPADLKANWLTQVLDEWKTLAILGGPSLVAQLAQMANGVIDTVMAGHSSAEDLAGVGIGTSLWVPVLLLRKGVRRVLQPRISGHRGAEQLQRIMPVNWQGLYIAYVCALVMILLLVNARPVLDLLQLDTRTSALSQGYLDAFCWGVPA